MLRSRREVCSEPDQATRSRAHSSCSEAQVLALACRDTATSTVGLFSTARRSRNQEVREMRRAVAGGSIAQIERHQAEPATLNQQVGGLQGVLGVV